MITATFLKQEIKGLKTTYKPLSKKDYRYIKYCEKEIIPFLETYPNENLLKERLSKIREILKAKNDQFEYWHKYVCPKEIPENKRRSLFNKETGITDLKRYIKTLKFILE